MRQVAFCAVLALCLGATVALNLKFDLDKDPYAFEGQINDTLEQLRASIPEPLAIADLPISFPEEDGAVLVGDADLSNMQVSGLHDFQVTALNFAMVGMRLNFTVVLGTLNINTDFLANLNLLHLIPFYGSGKANIHFEGFEVMGSAQADLNDGVQVKNLLLQLYVGASTFDVHGALDSEDFSAILSQLLNDMFTEFVDNHQPVITSILSPIVETIINGMLSGMSTDTTVAPTPSL